MFGSFTFGGPTFGDANPFEEITAPPPPPPPPFVSSGGGRFRKFFFDRPEPEFVPRLVQCAVEFYGELEMIVGLSAVANGSLRSARTTQMLGTATAERHCSAQASLNQELQAMAIREMHLQACSLREIQIYAEAARIENPPEEILLLLQQG